MSRPIRNSDGTFAGSIGDGKSQIPGPATTPHVPPGGFAQQGEVADLDAIVLGWAQWSKTKNPGPRLPNTGGYPDTDEEGSTTHDSLLVASVEDYLARTESVFGGTQPDFIPPADQALAEWESLNPHLDHAVSVLNDLEHSLAKRMDAEGVGEFDVPATDVRIHPVGGVRYSGWRHEDLQAAIISQMASGPEGGNQGRQEVAAVVNEYASYTTPVYYRTSALEAMNISPGDYATAGQDDRRLVLTGLHGERHVGDYNPVQLAARAHGARQDIAKSLERVPRIAEEISHLDLGGGLANYVAVRRHIPIYRALIGGLREVARRQVHLQGLDSVTSTSGNVYSVTPGRNVRTLSVSRARPYVLQAMSRDLRIPLRRVEAIVSRFEEVAQVTSYRMKAVEKKTSADMDSCLVTSRTRSRLVRASARNDTGGSE